MARVEAQPSPTIFITTEIERAARLLWRMPSRAEAEDFMQLDSAITAGVDLAAMLAVAGSIYTRTFNPLISLKALCFFEGGDLATLPSDVRHRLVTAVAAVDLDRLPEISPIRPPGGTAL